MAGVQLLQSSGKIPPALQIEPLVFNLPELGRALMVTYVWSSPDVEEGRRNLETIVELSPLVMNTVNETTAPAWMKQIGDSIPHGAWGGGTAVSFLTLSPKVLSIIGQALEVMPSDSGTGFAVHMLSPGSPTVTDKRLAEGSCFSPEARQGHFMLELLGLAVDPAKLEESQRWMTILRDTLRATGEAMKGTYVSIIKPGDFGLDNIYGDNWELVKSLKEKLDPDGFFRSAIPALK
jgi:hypothetical protein